MIAIHDVRKRFGALLALGGVSLNVAPGERLALVGTNGSGKTTLLRALCGLLRVEGHVEVCGVDVAKQPELALRSLSYMPQLAPPLDAPVGELLRAYCDLRASSREQTFACARRLGLDLQTIMRVRVRDLSGGMKQKLLAALALASEAPVLVCDEPTASLDAEARSAFFELVQARPKSSCLLLCSHRVDEVRQLVDRVVDGRVASDGALSDTLLRLPTSHIEIALREGSLTDDDLVVLETWGFRQRYGARFGGHFTQQGKIETIQRLVAKYGSRMLDLDVRDTESVHNRPVSMAAEKRAG